MSELSIPQTEVYLTPIAFNGLYEKGVAITPNADHIARMGEIIGNELPDYALPGDVESLSIIVRGSTTKEDKRKLTERDVEWTKTEPNQPFYPSDELQNPTLASALSVPKQDLMQPGRFILEFSGVNPGTWGSERPKRFAEQWTARRALSSVAANVPHEVAGAFSDMPLFGSKARRVARVLTAIKQEKLDPFFVVQRHGGVIR